MQEAFIALATRGEAFDASPRHPRAWLAGGRASCPARAMAVGECSTNRCPNRKAGMSTAPPAHCAIDVLLVRRQDTESAVGGDPFAALAVPPKRWCWWNCRSARTSRRRPSPAHRTQHLAQPLASSTRTAHGAVARRQERCQTSRRWRSSMNTSQSQTPPETLRSALSRASADLNRQSPEAKGSSCGLGRDESAHTRHCASSHRLAIRVGRRAGTSRRSRWPAAVALLVTTPRDELPGSGKAHCPPPSCPWAHPNAGPQLIARCERGRPGLGGADRVAQREPRSHGPAL